MVDEICSLCDHAEGEYSGNGVTEPIYFEWRCYAWENMGSDRLTEEMETMFEKAIDGDSIHCSQFKATCNECGKLIKPLEVDFVVGMSDIIKVCKICKPYIICKVKQQLENHIHGKGGVLD